MKHLLPLVTFLFFSLTLFSQDTIYFNKDWEIVSPEQAAYFRVDRKISSEKADLQQTTYFINGQIKASKSFRIKNDKKVPEGEHKNWYDNGQLWYTENYKNGKRDGELLAFWEDGSKRRHDYYKKGKLKSGRVWNRQGREEEHFPVMVPASFPGGQEALAGFLKEHLPVPDSQQTGTEVRLLVKIRINKEGNIDEIKSIEGAPHWYNAVTISTLSRMPKWNPGSFMGDPINVWFSLPVIFRK